MSRDRERKKRETYKERQVEEKCTDDPDDNTEQIKKHHQKGKERK